METKVWWKSKTIWLGIIEVLLGVLGAVATFLQLGVYTPEAYVILTIGIVTIILRKVTEVPIQ